MVLLKGSLVAGVVLAAIGLLAVTLLPFTDSKAWWIRMMGMPRVQLLVIAGVLAALALLLPSPWRTVALVMVAASAVVHVIKIAPYTPLSSKEIEFASVSSDPVKLMVANVLMENRAHDQLIDMVRSEPPDILFLVETNARWIEALEPLLEDYETVLRHPLENHYGMLFASNLTVRKSQIVYIGTDKIPTLFAELEDEQGEPFRFVGLHPTPPMPGEDTKSRDAKLAYAARFARKSGIPVVLSGDFNDAAWSRTAQRFKRVGGYLDPRIGRGPIPSFDAKSWIMRIPIDQLYVTPNVALVEFHRGRYFGSDHFPMHAAFRIEPDLAAELNAAPEALTEEEEAKVAETIELYAKGLDEDARDL